MSNIVADAVAGLGRGEEPTDERPLTDEERRQVARLLSDPFAFPQTFKTWLVAFLESSDLTLPISSISGLGATLGIGGGGNVGFIQGLFPAGTILGWSSSRIPSGCLRCDGAAYSRTAYARLFKEIGIEWGAGDGVTTFNVPDIRRRFPLGAGATGYGMKTNEGRAESDRSPDHHHYFDLLTDNAGWHGHSASADGVGDHSHSVSGSFASAKQIQQGTQGAWTWVAEQLVTSVGSSGAGGHGHGIGISGAGEHQHRINGNTTGGYDLNRPSFVAIHFVITT